MSSIYLKLQGFVNLEILESGFVLPFFGIGKRKNIFEKSFGGGSFYRFSAHISYNISCFCSVCAVFLACALQAEQAVARLIPMPNSGDCTLISYLYSSPTLSSAPYRWSISRSPDTYAEN
jgi:hypothetical protein